MSGYEWSNESVFDDIGRFLLFIIMSLGFFYLFYGRHLFALTAGSVE